MLSKSFLMAAIAVARVAASVPFLAVPCCPGKATVTYDKSVPDLTPFPLTQVDLCYDATSISITFTAYNETNFYYDPAQGTNDAIWEYEVMEAFIYHGTNDPKTYLEFEVNPNNVTFQAFIYNPSKVRAAGAAFDTAFWQTPFEDELLAQTTLDQAAHKWVSAVHVPLGLFNVDEGTGRGTQWRMNFFRTITSPSTYPNQTLGAWSPPNQPSFHMTPYFGHLVFV